MTALDDVERELGRVVDRLNSLPLGRVEPLIPRCHEVALTILAATRAVGGDLPSGAVLPQVGAQAAGAQLAVVGADFLRAAHQVPDPAPTPVDDVLTALTALRHSLP